MNIKELSFIFGSQTKAQEIMLVLHDTKPVVRQGFYPEELEKVKKFCEEYDLFLAKSSFKVLIENNDAYSNKGLRIPEQDGRRGLYFAYISKDEQKAWLAAYYELMENHQELGLLLGYPECCIDYFCRNFNENNPNPELLPTNPYTNLSQRSKDVVLLSHFPCSSNCNESLELGKGYWEIIRKADETRARELLRSLTVTV